MVEWGQELHRVELRLGERLEKHSLRMDERLEKYAERSDKRTIEMQQAIHALDVRMQAQHASLLKWSLTFWVGSVAAIAGLAGVLRWVERP